MAKSIMEIEDPDLRNAVWGFDQDVKKKAAKKNWQPPARTSRTFRDHCLENGTPEQAQESAELARKWYGD